MTEKSVLLLSGGPDSATLTKWAKHNGHEDIRALYLRTGHPTDEMEIQCADAIAAENGAQLEIIDVAAMVAALGGQRVLVHSEANIMPFGNAIVLSIAITYATKLGATSILIGLHADDAAESDEYTHNFIDALQGLADQTGKNVKLLTPFLDMRKKEVFSIGAELGVDYSKTWSCIRPGVLHCGYCGACRARASALEGIGLRDSTVYERPVVALCSVPVR